MVVLAVSITTRSGKPLVSRQFKDISRDRIMELLSNFQGLVANSSRQHTFVEEEHVRYVYKPFDDYYIILITNRQSNIIQDMDTLNLFSQTVNSHLKGFSEDEILDNAFDILGSFDEIISLGCKENLSLSQINTFLSMESHEEKLQEIIERNKEFEAAEERKRRAREISQRERERKLGIDPYAATEFRGSSDQNMSQAYSSYYSNASPAAQQSYKHLQQQQSHTIEEAIVPSQAYAGTSRGAGMKLGGKKGVHAPDLSSRSAGPQRVANMLQPVEEKRTNEGILVSVKETVNAEIARDGTISTSELKGVLELRIKKPELSHVRLILDSAVDVKDRSFQFKTHPNIDKALFMSSKVIGLKDPEKSFPSNDQSLGVLRWRKVGSADDPSLIPLQVSTWVSPADGAFDITVEFEINEAYNQEIKDLRFVLPLYTTDVVIKDDSNDVNAEIETIDEEHGIVVKVQSLVPGVSGVFCVSVETSDEEALFPMSVVFSHTDASKTFSRVGISKVTSAKDDAEELPFEATSSLRTDEYVVV
ncbi:AFR274Cp [Eremothecium gossypii ATCC 10895]|uniref:Coatomer subunit delta n=1 Tax=Eremothecium gossypii (strain ATCC 10895 / CBS 109.51 / FGSC 9923 / NRRL Y-1056) TaxID=284811 RepID=Q753N8_EREGS|nr:AFR274Cp [Eremothecium gossypii ATCC 10895]AAS53645.1 AFR274Cp [Eremothecium gossypii ATCC 10895]AEY97958.1 FAFR274Cp [Eremothecium gossypii FDAG1]